MKLFKLPLILCIILIVSIFSACGADDRLHGKSDNWDVSLQRSTGNYSITYIGDEKRIKDFVFDLTGNNIKQQGKALEDKGYRSVCRERLLRRRKRKIQLPLK